MWVDDLFSPEDRVWHASSMPEDQVNAWFDSLAPVPPEAVEQLDRIIDQEIAGQLKRPLRKACCGAISSFVQQIHDRPDVVTTSERIIEHIDAGGADPQLLTVWQRHLFAEGYRTPYVHQ